MKCIKVFIFLIMASRICIAGVLNCSSEDGSSIKAVVKKTGSIPKQIEYSIRGSSFKPASSLQYISKKVFLNGFAQKEKIETFAIRDSKTHELVAVVTNGSLIDKTGTYSVECSFDN